MVLGQHRLHISSFFNEGGEIKGLRIKNLLKLVLYMKDKKVNVVIAFLILTCSVKIIYSIIFQKQEE